MLTVSEKLREAYELMEKEKEKKEAIKKGFETGYTNGFTEGKTTKDISLIRK